jgi:hypothetical protein
MILITLIRIVIWLTFFLLIAEAAAVIIWARIAWKRYIIAHKELETRIETLERRQNLPL